MPLAFPNQKKIQPLLKVVVEKFTNMKVAFNQLKNFYFFVLIDFRVRVFFHSLFLSGE